MMSLTRADRLPRAGNADSAWQDLLAEGRAILQLAFPIALIALVNMGMSVTDALMVSQMYGTAALAAVAVGSDLYSILFYLCAGILAGLTPFYTAAMARGDGDERARLFRLAILIVLMLAALAGPAIWWAPDWLRALGLAPELLEEGRGYTRAMALTFVPMLGVMLYRTILTAAEKPKVFLMVTLAMLPLNAIGNYAFMTGIGPLPAFGPTGAGISSCIVALASLLLLALVGHRSRALGPAMTAHAADGRSELGDGAPGLPWRSLGPILRVGVPIGVATVTEVGIYLAATLYAARLGAADVAAHTLTLRVAGIAYALPAALLQAAMVRMARAESIAAPAQRDAAGRAVIAGTLGLGIVSGLVLLMILAGGALPLAHSFFDGGAAGIAAAGIAGSLLILLGCIELVACPGLAAAGLLRGRRDARVPMLYTLGGYWLMGAPLGIHLCEARGLGITGIWIGLAAGTLTTTILTLARLFRR